MNLGYIFLIIIAAVIVIVLIFLMISKSKGKIVIELSKYDYSPGDTINGKVILKLKKPVKAKSLEVGLIGISESTSYNRTGKRASRTNRSDFAFEFEKPISGEKDYSGETGHNFNILIPKNILTKPEGTAGTLIKTAQILSGNITNIKWYVTASLNIPGFDIYKKVQINIG